MHCIVIKINEDCLDYSKSLRINNEKSVKFQAVQIFKTVKFLNLNFKFQKYVNFQNLKKPLNFKS